MPVRFFLTFVALALLTGCDRPLLDEVPPDLTVVSPDLGVVQLTPDVTLRVSAQALRGVERVRIGGLDAAYDPAGDVWEADIFLSLGTNAVPLEAFSTDGTTAQDTAFVVFAPLSVTSPPVNVLPEPRAGLTATRVSTSGVLVAGGAGTGGSVLQTAHLLTESGFSFTVGDPIAMQRRRTGHAALRLLDDRVLLLGGTSTPSPTQASFVSDPEVIDLATQTSRRVVVRGDPIRRTGHTATLLDLDGRQYVYVVGGQTPGSGGLLTPATVEIAELREGPEADTLVTLTQSGGASNGAAFPDPIQVVVGTRSDRVTAVVTGLAENPSAPEAQRMLYATPGTLFYPFSINAGEIAPPLVPRAAAGGARLAGDLALLVGGANTTGQTLRSLEVYSDTARRWVAFPASVALGTPRRDLAVTLAPSGRILAIGGRGPAGQPLATLDVLSY